MAGEGISRLEGSAARVVQAMHSGKVDSAEMRQTRDCWDTLPRYGESGNLNAESTGDELDGARAREVEQG